VRRPSAVVFDLDGVLVDSIAVMPAGKFDQARSSNRAPQGSLNANAAR